MPIDFQLLLFKVSNKEQQMKIMQKQSEKNLNDSKQNLESFTKMMALLKLDEQEQKLLRNQKFVKGKLSGEINDDTRKKKSRAIQKKYVELNKLSSSKSKLVNDLSDQMYVIKWLKKMKNKANKRKRKYNINCEDEGGQYPNCINEEKSQNNSSGTMKTEKSPRDWQKLAGNIKDPSQDNEGELLGSHFPLLPMKDKNRKVNTKGKQNISVKLPPISSETFGNTIQSSIRHRSSFSSQTLSETSTLKRDTSHQSSSIDHNIIASDKDFSRSGEKLPIPHCPDTSATQFEAQADDKILRDLDEIGLETVIKEKRQQQLHVSLWRMRLNYLKLVQKERIRFQKEMEMKRLLVQKQNRLKRHVRIKYRDLALMRDQRISSRTYSYYSLLD